MIRLSAFADEISQDPVEQVDVLAAHGIKHIEFRAIHGTNVLDLGDAQHAEFRDLLRSRGFGLSAIGSPIGKIRITEPFDEHLHRFDRAMDLADFYQTPRIRVFSFYMPPGTIRPFIASEVMSRMTELSRRRGRAGSPCSSKTRRESTATRRRASPMCSRRSSSPCSAHAFDPANYVEVGQPIEEAWSRLRSHVNTFPRQGLRREDPPQRAGRSGRRSDPRLARRGRRPGYDGFCVLEPHLVVAELSFGFTGPERFADAANALKQILDDRSIAFE